MQSLLELPIDAKIDEITQALCINNVVLIAEPGAGKTTRVPRALLEKRIDKNKKIIVLEPRRIATRLAAARVAEELGEPLGKRVGYQMRFERCGNDSTQLWFLTEGLLTRWLVDNPTLEDVGIVIFDEFHERHIHGDIGLSVLRKLQLSKRPDLRLMLMSATIDAAALNTFVDGSVIEVKGRIFPVDIQYIPHQDQQPLEQCVSNTVKKIVTEKTKGDILVFLPGVYEIKRAVQACARFSEYEVVSLYGEMTIAEQERAIRSSSKPKIICATNVAETSITIPTVTTVIDSGLARIANYSPWTGLPTLDIGKISQASAQQRSGRAGRVSTGQCFRLYSKHDFETRSRYDDPEIRRSDLIDMALLLIGLGYDPLSFSYVEAPRQETLLKAMDLLERLGAFQNKTITALGRKMLAIPLHPRLSKITLEAKELTDGVRGAMIATLLSERDILRTQNNHLSQDTVGHSDLLFRLEYIEDESRLNDGFDSGSMKRILHAFRQIAQALKISYEPSTLLYLDEEALLRATLLGFPDRVAKKRDKNSSSLLLSQGGTAELSKASVVKDSEFLVIYDAVKSHTTTIARGASAIEVEWLLEYFPDRVVENKMVRFNSKTERVEEVRILKYDSLVLDESINTHVISEEAESVLLKAIYEVGLQKFWDLQPLTTLKSRIQFARTQGCTLKEIDEATIDEALKKIVAQSQSFSDVRAASFIDVLQSIFSFDETKELDKVAPLVISIPGRPKVVVHYELDRSPWVESRLQDFFGLKESPKIAMNRVPLVIHLLAPNQRAVQVTTDLAGFWERHYPSIRKELMRKYPRHRWPENPIKPS